MGDSLRHEACVRRVLTIVTASGVLLWGAPGCSASGPEGPLAQRHARILGGEPSPRIHDAVVFTRVDFGDRYADCTATLIAPQVILTAKHCVTAVGQGEFVCSATGELEADGTGAGVFGATAEPSMVAVWVGASPGGDPAGYGLEILASGADDACHDDIALVVLDRELPLASTIDVRREPSTRPGDRVTLIGYGSGDAAPPSRRELHEVRVLEVGELESGSGPVAPRTFTVGGGTVCSGDSGGPALAETDGAQVGVYSRISGDCAASGSRNTFVLAAEFAPLMDAALERAGADRAGGAAGTSGALDSASGAAGADAQASSRPRIDEDDALRCTSAPSTPSGAALLLLALASASLRRRRCRSDACAGGRCRSAPGG